ncbi:unnamed protein product [Protopolystoma xenopodis]|uniref:Uncharacterized protein n=1 Tax=Protopolystoma xenopodis TaxID=117903 RepID=A0A448X2B5_9PLAT|nr:unnamed protein product [Protopolystoma xenopodis]
MAKLYRGWRGHDPAFDPSRLVLGPRCAGESAVQSSLDGKTFCETKSSVKSSWLFQVVCSRSRRVMDESVHDASLAFQIACHAPQKSPTHPRRGTPRPIWTRNTENRPVPLRYMDSTQIGVAHLIVQINELYCRAYFMFSHFDVQPNLIQENMAICVVHPSRLTLGSKVNQPKSGQT